MYTRPSPSSLATRACVIACAVAMAVFSAATTSAADDASANQSSAAMRMYRDPQTGQLGAPPPGALGSGSVTVSEAAQPSAAQELTSEPLPGGGRKVDLHGRFMAAVQRHADGSGTATHECVQAGTAVHE